MKMGLNWDEWWAVLSITTGDGVNKDEYPPVDFTEEEVAEIERVSKEWNAIQRKIADKFGMKDPDQFDLVEKW